MASEKSEKNLLMNVSKDEMDTIDEILQSRQPGTLSDKKPGKLPVKPRTFIPGSAKLNFPVSVLLQASNALNELAAVRKQCKTAAESAAPDDGNDIDNNITLETPPETLEDLILFEHNYAVKYSPISKSKKNKNGMEIDAQENCDKKEVPENSIISEVLPSASEVPEILSVSEVPKISSGSEVPEVSSISTPIRRSKRQIAKLEREQEAAANVDTVDHEISKEKVVKHEKVKLDNNDTGNLKIDSNLNPEEKLSNYKSFAEFKKRHLKVVVEDYKKVKNVDSVSRVLFTSTEEILHDSADDKTKSNSIVDDKDIENLKIKEPQPKSKYTRKTKTVKPHDVESDENSKIHKALVRKNKSPNLITKNTDSSPTESPESKEKSDKIVSKNVLKEKKKTIEHDKQKDSTRLGKKRKKHVSSSDKLSSNAEIQQLADSPHVNKRKKTVSFSEELIAGNKPEAIPKKPRISSDSKELNKKSAVSSPTISTPPKVQKKKIVRRDSLRLINDGPALFSQPDVMIKVSTDDSSNRKDERESDSSPNKVKTSDLSGIKNSVKENDILPLETKQEKEAFAVTETEKEESSLKLLLDDIRKQLLKQEDKEKQTLKMEEIGKQTLKQENGEKELKQEDKLESKMGEEGEMLKHGDKDILILNQEEHEKQVVLKEDLSKVNQKEEKNQIPKALEEKQTEKDLEEKQAEAYQDEKHKDREKLNEEESLCKDDDSHVQQMDCSDNIQDLEGEFDQQKEIQHSYNNFTNIEAFLESSKFHTTNQEVSELDTNDLKCDSKSTIEATKKVADDANTPKKESKNFNDEKLLEPVHNTESDSQVPENVVTTDEVKLVPERKSRRLIKKKEFFGDTSDSSDSKKVSAAKNKRTNVDKPSGRGRRSGINNKKGEMDGRNGHLEQDVSTDPDSSEEDDPKKLWCICRKPHNSRFMIQCDKCEDWFHGSCVGVTKQYGRQLEKQKKEWNCPSCRSKGELSSQKVEKSTKTTDEGKGSNKKNIINDGQDESRKKPLLRDVNMPNSADLEYNKMPVQDAKNVHASALDQLPRDTSSVKKEKVSANIVEKSDKISKGQILKQTLQQKPPAAVKQNLSGNIKTPDDSLKLSNSSKQSSLSNAKTEISSKSPMVSKQSLPNSPNWSPSKKTSAVKVGNRSSGKTTVFMDPKKKLINSLKEKDALIKKKQCCVHCQSEARANSSYCSDGCIEKYAAQCLKTMHEAKGALKGPEFDSQRLVVLDSLKGNLLSGENGPTAGEIVSWLKSNPSYIITISPSNSSIKKDTNSPKKEPESNSNSERRDDESAKTTIRLNVRKTLKNILLERCKKADDLEMSEDNVQKIAVKIEEELNAFFKDNSFKYRAKYRSLMFNIKDPRNQGLFRKILKGNIPPDKLVRMTPEELASVELAKWREQENQHLLDMIKRVQLEQQKSGSGLLLKKTHKGEVEIEDDLTSIIEQDIPKTIVKDLPDEVAEPEKEEAKDSTHLHRSHLFDLNCKICTGKIVPPPVDENVPKKVRVAHSISVDLASPNTSETVEKSVVKVIEGKSPVSNAGDDSMDQVPTSTVFIESPEINIKSAVKDAPSKTFSSVWKGFIFMQDIAKFVTSAYKVSGPTDHLQADLPDTIQVCGRIVPDQVWDYLGKIKQSGNKELVIIRFQAANEEEAVTYNSFYSYLSSRKRYGVVSNYSKKIKDFYLLPLAATSPVPMVLVPFDGPGLPTPRPHLLLGVIVRHKIKHASSPVVSRQPLPSKVDSENSDGSYTPPHEPRSYTPPLPTLSSKNEPKEQEDQSVVSPDSADKEDPNAYDSLERDNSVDKPAALFSDKTSISDVSSIEKDDDKPYDPEQDILNLATERPKTQKSLDDNKETSPVHLEQQKKILDALNREVEETENALKQLISHPDGDAVVQSPNAPSLDINSVAETGMSSFLDLPENLQEILNAVKSKTCDKEKGDVDMRIKTLFGKRFNEPKSGGIYKSEIIRGSVNSTTLKSLEEYNPQAATPPPNDEDMDRSSIACPSDPRIKLRTSFQDASFISKDKLSSNVSLSSMSVPDVANVIQQQLPVETESEVTLSKPKSLSNTTLPPNVLLSGWNSSKEPPPPGIEPTESPSQESLSIEANVHTSLPPAFAASVQDTSQHVTSTFYPQAFPSFQPHLPLGFSVHTPPPNINHFPPPPIVSTTFPPPPPLPMHVPPPQATDANLVKEQWTALPSSQQSEGSEWHAGSSHWKETADHQGNQSEGDSRYYSSDRSNDYGDDNFYKRDSSNRHWDRPRGFARGHWVKNPSRGRFTNQRRGKRDPLFRRERNQRN